MHILHIAKFLGEHCREALIGALIGLALYKVISDGKPLCPPCQERLSSLSQVGHFRPDNPIFPAAARIRWETLTIQPGWGYVPGGDGGHYLLDSVCEYEPRIVIVGLALIGAAVHFILRRP